MKTTGSVRSSVRKALGSRVGEGRHTENSSSSSSLMMMMMVMMVMMVRMVRGGTLRTLVRPPPGSY